MKLSFTGFNVALVLLLVPGIARAENPDLMTLIGASSWGSAFAARDNSGNDVLGNASTYGLSSSDHNSFAVDYGNRGVLRGHGRCSARAGIYPWNNDTYEIYSENFVDTLTDETGSEMVDARYCYCGLDSYTASGGSATALSGPWVYAEAYEQRLDCADFCAGDCAFWLENDGDQVLAFRAAVFNAYAPSSSASGDAITTQTYVDNALNAKQAKITTTGTNKLMTYGASTGATPGSRDIVSTLGTSTTATTVPETGPIVAGIANKQDAVNGTANYIMTGTGTAGTVGEKPVYSSTNNYDIALVEAQTINTTATTAANSELSCIDNDCLLWQINTSGPAGISTRIYLDPSIAGTSYCGRPRVANGDVDGSCSSDTLNYIGARGSYTGKWGAVFPYGELVGKGVCSTINGETNGTVATVAQASTLNDVFAASTGTTTSTGGYCWCKMEGPVSSEWVYYNFGLAGDQSYCTRSCGKSCGSAVINNLAVRTAMFDSVK